MKNTTLLFLLFTMTILWSCFGSKKAAMVSAVSFEKDVYPIIADRCTPCHFPEKGKKLPLNTYEANRDNINDIIARVSLPQDNREFMPFKMKKPALTDSMVQVLVQWKEQGFPK